jgi:transcriptional regulator with XRE-family HTH domain
MSVGPTVLARVLGTQLAEKRVAAKITQRDAAKFARISQSKLSEIESGRTPPSPGDVLVLLRYYKADEPTVEQLLELQQGAEQRGWWNIYRLPQQLELYVGLESDAVSLRAMELQLVPGILQSEDYARKLHRLRGLYSCEEVEERVAVRMQRQERLVDGSLQLVAVLDEATLLRCARDPDVAASQLRHLLERAQLPNVTVRVLPLGLGLHVGTGGAFSILTFPNKTWKLPDVAHQEYVVGGHIIDDQIVVSQLDRLFDELRIRALGANESLDLISEFVDSITT